jgi:glycosyltransferase involved in cell wall biosynthesis
MRQTAKRILYLVREDFDEVFGGDVVQVKKTREFLVANFPVQIDLKKSADRTLRNDESYDLVHVFNLQYADEFLKHAEYFSSKNVPILLSTIYWSKDELKALAYVGFRRRLLNLLPASTYSRTRAIRRMISGRGSKCANWQTLLKGERALKSKFLNLVDILLPNSESEMDCVRSDFERILTRHRVVFNGVDLPACEAIDSMSPDPAFAKFQNSVVCACRIDERKNTLNLVRALSGQPFQVFLIGNVSPESRGYYESVKALAGPNITMLPALPQKDLFSVFREAAVHVLPSWFETPGLSNLEAAAFGCRLVISPKGSTRDYFGDRATYCDPGSTASILGCTRAALLKGKDRDLASFVRRHYSWAAAAEATFDAYSSCFDPSGASSSANSENFAQ